MGHSDQVVRRRARCLDMYQRRFSNVSQPVSLGMHSSSHQQQDGDAAMQGAHMESPVRYTPYAISPFHRRGSFLKQDQTHVNMEREQKPQRRVEVNRPHGTLGSWFKITIPFGIKYDEKWLLNLIQNKCSVSFIPVEFHYEKMNATFYVENASIASALKNVSGKIWDEDNEKISIFVCPDGIPHSVQRELKPEKVEQLAVNQQQALDIQKLPIYSGMAENSDSMADEGRGVCVRWKVRDGNLGRGQYCCCTSRVPPCLLVFSSLLPGDFMTCDTKMAPNPRKGVAASLHAHEENIPKVMSSGEMDKWKGIEPGEKCVDRSPVCTTFLNNSSNINSILELFPKLLCLDGQQSPGPTLCGLEAHKRLPTCKGSFFGSEMLKNLVLQFLQQYYLIYDSGDRRGLLGAYHNEACFSLSISFNHGDSALSILFKYFKDNRNIKMLQDPYLRGQLLKHTKRDIVDFLSALPKTQHDLSSILVDMWYQTEWMLCFSVNGVFKEVEGQSQGSVLAFTRTFITTPGSSSSLCILNDELFLRGTSHQRTQSALFTLVPTPFSSSMPAFSQEQKKMVKGFSAQSGMNFQCSQKCLHNNQQDYSRAVPVLAPPKVCVPMTESGDLAGAEKPKPNSQS
ncbi:nuclear RNA export factor 3 isoform X2 [Callithrix jacchus]|uniref:nuclear RNA export factor 3 isoform X2 n=1 Tax=Callithrix jacchus TaxID=9483 RepID=UPI00159ECDC9|nr:nuclear RNA export factor 3 isoform X2 [Callithrix jacchus]